MSNVSLLALAKADIKAAEMCVDHKDKLVKLHAAYCTQQAKDIKICNILAYVVHTQVFLKPGGGLNTVICTLWLGSIPVCGTGKTSYLRGFS